jgi:hypothetical protein
MANFFNTFFPLQFTSITMPPAIKTTTRNGRTLVHRVPSAKENNPPEISMVPLFFPSHPACITHALHRGLNMESQLGPSFDV